MTKKLTYQGTFKSYLLLDELMEAFPQWSGVTDEGTTRLESYPTKVHVYTPDNADEQEIQTVIDAHDPNALSIGEQNQASINDAKARFLLSELKDKTPEEIYTLMQTRMDSWTTLADARPDLREWLPLMAAIIAWTIARE